MSMKVATLQQDKSKRNGNKYVMSTNFTGMMQITESECLKLRAGVRGGGGGGWGWGQQIEETTLFHS